jgi:hypothetical protein
MRPRPHLHETAPKRTARLWLLGLARSRHRVRRTLPARAEHPRKSAFNFLGQIGRGVFGGDVFSLGRREARAKVGRSLAALPYGLVDRTAVSAFHFAEPPDEVHAGAHRAVVQIGSPVVGSLTARADKYLTIVANAAAPGALPPVRVDLPCTAPIAGHAACSDSAEQPEMPR